MFCVNAVRVGADIAVISSDGSGLCVYTAVYLFTGIRTGECAGDVARSCDCLGVDEGLPYEGYYI